MDMRAFTLIELLVVISIIALLMGILQPSLEKARTTAQAVACLSSLKQFAVGAHIFAEDHRDTLPEAYPGNKWWVERIGGEYFGFSPDRDSDLWCPAESTGRPGSGVHGSQERFWDKPSTRNYGMNDFGAANSAMPHEVKLSRIKHPYSVFLFTDTYPSYYQPFGRNFGYWVPSYFGGRSYEPVAYTDYRHNGKVNMVYIDGHADVPWHDPNAGHLGGPGLTWLTFDNHETVWNFITYRGGNQKMYRWEKKMNEIK